jgi:hypothetical protein
MDRFGKIFNKNKAIWTIHLKIGASEALTNIGLNDKIRQPAEVVNSLSESFNELLISGE